MISISFCRVYTGLVGAALVMLGAQSVAAQSSVPINTYELRNVRSGKCLDVAGAKTNPGANVQQWTCVHDPQQLWRATFRGSYDNNGWTLTNVKSQLYLEVVDNLRTNTANVQQGTGSGAEDWSFVNKGGGQFEVHNLNSGKCLEVAGGGMGDEVNVYQNLCDGSTKQLWQFVLVGPDTVDRSADFAYELRPSQVADRSMCLTVAGASLTDEANVEQDYCVADIHQSWRLDDIARSGYYHLINEHSGLCLDVAGGNPENRANVQQYTCVASAPQQRWKPEYMGNALFQLVNEKGYRCLDVSEGKTDPKQNVQQWDCVGVPQQLWEMILTSF